MNELPHEIRYLCAAAIADLLGVRAGAVRRWAKQGQIPHLVLPGGRRVFDPVEVIAALKLRQGQWSCSSDALQGGRHGQHI